MNLLDEIRIGDDPLVLGYLQHLACHQSPETWSGPNLSSTQKREFDRITEEIRDTYAKVSGHERVEYIERKLTIIAGPFCSATGHAADLLSLCGVPCTHEVVMMDKRLFLNPVVVGACVAECSGDADFWVNTLENAKLVHLIRDPLKAVNSLYWLRNEELKPVECINYVLNFHKTIEARKPDIVWRIERKEEFYSVLDFFKADVPLNYVAAARDNARRNNHQKGKETKIYWNELPVSLQQFSLKHGYKPEV
jgi:hypothetical protein